MQLYKVNQVPHTKVDLSSTTRFLVTPQNNTSQMRGIKGDRRCPFPCALSHSKVEYMISVLSCSASPVSLSVPYGTPAPSPRRNKAFLKQD